MAVSLKDISAKVHVNTCSVSQVLNNHPRAQSLRPETREKILAAARELGYFKNEMAASVVRKNSRLLAFVADDMGSIEYTGRIQNGVLEAAGEYNYLIMLHRLAGSSPEDTLRKILGWRAAGVVFHVSTLSRIAEITENLDKHGIPWGTVNLSNPGGIGSTSDDFAGVEDLVGAFCRSGHKKTAYLYIDTGSQCEFRLKRKAGYQSGIKKHCSAGNEIFIPLAKDLENMPEVTAKIRRENIDAVICESDHLAAGVLRQATLDGLRVPEDFSIAGFGNSVISEYTLPPLTTVAQDFELMGRETIRQIVDFIEKNKKDNADEGFLPTKIIFRQSVRCSAE